MQATVERALGRAHQFEPGTQMASWLFRIAKNLRIDSARSAARRGTQIAIDEAQNSPAAMGSQWLKAVRNWPLLSVHCKHYPKING